MPLELLDLALKRLSNLEKKVEKYFDILKIDNELDFILKGGYVFNEDINNILNGNYTLEANK